MKKHNFSAGPAILPASVLKKASESVADLGGSGLSILEISHRSPEFKDIMNRAVGLVRELLQLPDNYEVLFLTGGASTQFFMTAMNILGDQEKAGYVDTGSWSSKAIKEARLFGQVEVLASSKDKNYTYIPKSYPIPSDLKYLHITSNNTIFGTEYHQWPETDLPLICDMSSDIFSKPIDIERFGLIYAGAQKNLGPAGTTLVIVQRDLLNTIDRVIPTMLNYQTHIEKNSAYNTPPVFPIYVCMLTLEWLQSKGGLDAIAEHNRQKAEIIYRAIDGSALYKGTVEKEDRSLMNATFLLAKPELEDAFLKACTEAGCEGIKGHRSVGGFRASIYNSMPLDSARVLADVMDAFAQKHAG
jgi:phosphoserine aminotransferase